MSKALDITVRRNQNDTTPDHHVLASADASKGWSSYLPSWNPAPGPARVSKEPELKTSRKSTSSL